MRPNSLRIITLFILLLPVIAMVSCSKEKKTGEPQENNQDIQFSFETIVSGITQVTAEVSVSLVEGEPQGLQSFGFVYSDSPNPTLDDTVIEASSGSQSLNFSLDYLEANTSYYIRPFLVDNSGTNFGEEQQFTSLEHLIFNGEVILGTQEQVDDFGAQGYTKIIGRISLTGPGINNLESLSSLLEIEALDQTAFGIAKTNCTSLQGLGNLRRIDGSIYFYQNLELRNFEGFDKLKTITGALVAQEDGFVNFRGLSSLETIGIGPNIFGQMGAGLVVSGEANLVNFEGLEQLRSIEGYLRVNSGFMFESFIGLNNLRELPGGLSLRYSGANNFEGLESLEFTLFLSVELSSLQNFNGLNSLNRIGGSLTVFFNSELVNFDGLQSLESVLGPMTISNNNNLVSLDGLENWERTSGTFYILDNDVLTDLCGVQNLVQNDTFPFIALRNAYNPTRKDMENGNCRFNP